jgi:hypothetical protein
MSADISPLASLMPPFVRAGWETFVMLMVTVMASFWEALPHLVQLGGGVIVALTIWEKPTVQALVTRLRTRNQERKDDASGR